MHKEMDMDAELEIEAEDEAIDESASTARLQELLEARQSGHHVHILSPDQLLFNESVLGLGFAVLVIIFVRSEIQLRRYRTWRAQQKQLKKRLKKRRRH